MRLLALLVALLGLAAAASAQTPSGLTLQVAPEHPNYYPATSFACYVRSDADAYAYVFLTEGDGVVRQIFPNRYDRDNALKAGVTRRIPDGGYRLEIEGAPGAAEVFVVASTEPLPRMQAEYGPDQMFREPYPRVWTQPRAVYDGVVAQAQALGKPVRYGWAARPFTVQPPRGKATYYDREERLRPAPTSAVVENQDWRAEYRQRGRARLRVTSEPDEANVYVDGKLFGETPQTISLDAGDHTIRVEKRRYRTWERDVDLEAGTMKTFNITLRRESSSDAPSGGSNSNTSGPSRQPIPTM